MNEKLKYSNQIANPSHQLKAVKDPTPAIKKEPTPAQLRAKKQHEICEAKLNTLVLEYFRVSKDDSLGAKFHFDKYNSEWKTFAFIKNKQQRDIKLYPNAFETNVNTFLEHAKTQLRLKQEAQQQENEAKSETE